MGWNDQKQGDQPGKGGRGSRGNGSGGGFPPFDLNEFLKRRQRNWRDWRGWRDWQPNGVDRRGGALIGAIAAGIWLASGIYVVNPDEQGVVLRFGGFSDLTGPGIHFRLPWPVDSVTTVKVTRENQTDIGYRVNTSGPARNIPEESLSLTGDENIVDIDFTVFWRIKDAAAFLFNVDNRGQDSFTVKAVAESAMREVIGRNKIEVVLTSGRDTIQTETRDLIQKTLDLYGAGVTVTRVQMQKADPPPQVLASYRDVQAARTDQDRMRNEAEAYANKAVPEARGGAARILQQGEGYKQQVTAESQGEAARFMSVYGEYKKAPAVTRQRIYIETMESVFSGVNKTIIDRKAGTGVVPYLPLPSLQQDPPPRVVAPAGSRPNTIPPLADAARSGR